MKKTYTPFKEIRMLPMPEQDYTSQHNHPPRKSEGALYAELTTDLFYPDGRLLLEKGRKGYIMPFLGWHLKRRMEEHEKWLHNIFSWGHDALGNTWDFFYEKTRPDGKIRPTEWHTFIRSTDFKVLDKPRYAQLIPWGNGWVVWFDYNTKEAVIGPHKNRTSTENMVHYCNRNYVILTNDYILDHKVRQRLIQHKIGIWN